MNVLVVRSVTAKLLIAYGGFFFSFLQMSNYKRATFEEEEGSDIPPDGAISPDSVEVS